MYICIYMHACIVYRAWNNIRDGLSTFLDRIRNGMILTTYQFNWSLSWRFWLRTWSLTKLFFFPFLLFLLFFFFIFTLDFLVSTSFFYMPPPPNFFCGGGGGNYMVIQFSICKLKKHQCRAYKIDRAYQMKNRKYLFILAGE